MSNKYKKLLLIFIFINFGFFIYYCLLPDMNPANDAFYYMSIGDSLYSGTGFYDITTAEPHPIITPQNGIAFVHLFLLWTGLHNPDHRLLAIKIINYLGFLCIVFIFYQIFIKLKVSIEITVLSLGIILLSAFFIKTIMAPVNEGFWCFLTALIFYLIIYYDRNNSYLAIGLIYFLSIIVVNFKMNGSIIIFSASLAYLLIKMQKKALMYFSIFIVSCISVVAILGIFKIDLSGMKSLVNAVYTQYFYLNKILMIIVYTIPGVFLGISGRTMIVAIPLSIVIIIYYIYFLIQSIKEKNLIKLVVINYILLSILSMFIATGHDSRFIIMILPFSLLTIAVFFKNNKYLKVSLWTVLLFTLSVSCYRLFCWDIVFFSNKRSLKYVKENIVEPYTLISDSSRYSYYIFNKRANSTGDIKKGGNPIILFGNKKFISTMSKIIEDRFKVFRIENLKTEFIMAHKEDEIYNVTKIVVE